jgi:DnaJ-class molecular chaperone
MSEPDGIVCAACRGSGRTITEDHFTSCLACGGTGENRELPQKDALTNPQEDRHG